MHAAIASWLDGDNYKFSTKTSMTEWAYEFLRRNHDYQNDVKEFLRICNDFRCGFNPFMHQSGDSYDDVFDELRHFEPPLNAGESEAEWLQRLAANGESGKSTPLDIWYGKKWGLETIIDPCSEFNSIRIRFINNADVKIAGPGWFKGKENKLISTSKEQAFIIDYSLPLPIQLKRIKQYTARHYEWLKNNGHLEDAPNKRARAERYIVYLRCLDAVDSGVEHALIAKTLCPEKPNKYPDYNGSKTVFDWIKSAEELRDKNYIYLPLIKSK